LSVGSITTTGGRKTVHCGLNSAGAARRREMKFEYIITRASLTVGTHRLIRERSKTEVCGRERSQELVVDGNNASLQSKKISTPCARDFLEEDDLQRSTIRSREGNKELSVVTADG